MPLSAAECRCPLGARQDFGEFVEDRFVELYGLKKIAETNLRDTLKGLKQNSEGHTRLSIFRAVTALVPGDDEGETDASPVSNQAAIFMRKVLGYLVKVRTDDRCAAPCCPSTPLVRTALTRVCDGRRHRRASTPLQPQQRHSCLLTASRLNPSAPRC